MNFDQVHQNLQKNRTDMSDLQNQAASQKRLNKPSDDPVGAARVLATRTEDRGLNQFVKNIHQARSFLDMTDQALNEMSDLLVRAKELAVQQANDAGANPETRQVAALEIGQTFSQAVQIGNRKLGERYIFGGFKTTTSPFNQAGDYKGDDGDMNVLINKDAEVAMNLPGSRVFGGVGVSADGHLRAKMDSPKTAEDLNQYQRDNEELRQEIEDGRDEEFVLRGPASSTETSRRRQVETVPQNTQDGINVFRVLKNFEIALRTNDKEEIQIAIDDIDRSLSQVIQGRAQVGARVQTLNQTQESLQKSLVDNKALQSQIEDADLFQTVSDISKTDSALRASLETSGRLVQKSLLDFLR
ncbi:MAG: flagellar hook-associated protein FlgL [Bdellovibrionaceae bacterium]|nr:flagellar hook-associated protein FlgL [Pseudobdellovibrionaceae bacterium]